MLEALVNFLLTKLFSGGPESLLAVAIAIIFWLVFDRQQLQKRLEKKDEKIDQIIDDYHKGNITLADALTSLKIVLFEIRAKL